MSLSPRALRWLLVASLALNVLVIGVITGAICLSHFGHGRHMGPPKGGLLGFARSLPDERGGPILQKFDDGKETRKNLRSLIRDARAKVRAAIIAEPFDQAKLDEALNGIVNAETEIARDRVSMFNATVQHLTPEERRQLHDWLEKHRPMPKPPGH
ncbi:periplasmic heavy metal sensor [Hyphomicrobium sp. D-2]|uniref:periplasmic heavy metal sensor n=1 Tax=Hyphomicrobium sp. D-2 TaxID=3041621 RepID=UPI00245457D6|nr:periplasmic heavy metal sensor [Hyphomicrobium sp. D-2]MDH4981327.1 periplasmic heavy metal sensor [Hyphomicrobium sp. D-2]